MGPHWIGRRLYCGQLVVGSITEDKHNPGKWLATCNLPGGRGLIGPFDNEQAAAKAAVRENNARCKMMFGAGMKTTELAVHEGRKLRQIARVIFRAGVWVCDREANVPMIWRDLAAAIGMSRDDAPSPAGDMTPEQVARSSAGQFVERDPREIEAPDDWQPMDDEPLSA